MSKAKDSSTAPNIFDPTCSARHVLELVANKWAMLIIYALNEGPQRNGELLRKISDVSQKMLTQTLRELERNGLVKRTDFTTTPPKVQYALTDIGHSLALSIAYLDDWAKTHFHLVDAARERSK
jgi:DNA-binding HxlR family transcriptional regulator